MSVMEVFMDKVGSVSKSIVMITFSSAIEYLAAIVVMLNKILQNWSCAFPPLNQSARLFGDRSIIPARCTY